MKKLIVMAIITVMCISGVVVGEQPTNPLPPETATTYEAEAEANNEPVYDEVAEQQDEIYRIMVKSGNAPTVADEPMIELVQDMAEGVTQTVFHSKATLEAERRGTTTVDGWIVWADTLEEVQPDEDGYMPYEEYYYFDENGNMPSEVTAEQKQTIAMVWDTDAGKKIHDSYCNEAHESEEE